MSTWALREVLPRSSSDTLVVLFRAQAAITADHHTSFYKKRWLGVFFCSVSDGLKK